MSDARRCPQCGLRSVRKRRGKGRVVRYRCLGALPIPDAAMVPQCLSCEQIFIDEVTAAELNLESLYDLELRRRAKVAIERLCPKYCSQRDLERLLGLSHGWTSHLARGNRNTSEALVAVLALLARDPELRILDLRRFWEEPPPSKPAMPRRRRSP